MECLAGEGSVPSFPYASANLYSLQSVAKKSFLSAGCNLSNFSPNQIHIWKILGCTAIFKVWVLGLTHLLYIFKSDVHAVLQTTPGALYLNVYFNLCSIICLFLLGMVFCWPVIYFIIQVESF